MCRLPPLKAKAAPASRPWPAISFCRSPLALTTFQRRDAREWLVNDADPATLAGFTYLDRVDLLALPDKASCLPSSRPCRIAPLAAPSCLPPRKPRCARWPARDCFFPTSLTVSPPSASPFRRCGSAAKTLPPLAQIAARPPLLSAISSAPLSSAPAPSPACCSTPGPATCANWPPSSKTALLEASHGVIRPEDLALPNAAKKPQHCPSAAYPDARPENLSLDAIIRHHVQYVLDLNRGNKLRAARQLAISRSTLYRILGNESILAH